MQTWEYFTFEYSSTEHEDDEAYQAARGNFTKHLNLLGRQGWELVSAFIDAGEQHFFFKRPTNR